MIYSLEINTLEKIPASHFKVLGSGSGLQLPADVDREVRDNGSSCWVPAIHVEDLNLINDALLQPGLDPHIVGIWRLNQRIGALTF